MNRGLGMLGLLAAGLLGTACSPDVKIGAVISSTGGVASYGAAVRRGLDLARDEINAAGGLKRGGTISLLYRDDATLPGQGRQATLELIEREHVGLIIGAISSPVSLAIAPLCEERHVLMLSPSASHPDLSRAGAYVYRIYPSDIGEGTSMARFAKDLGLERMVVFATDSEYGRGLGRVFAEQYESRFRQVVETFRFAEGQMAMLREMVARARALGADGVYLVAYPQEVAALLREFRRAEMRAVVMASSAVTPEIVRLAGEAAENLVFPQTTLDLESGEPAVAAFVRAYRARYGEDPDIYSAHGYDALKILVAAIDAVGSTHPDDVRRGLDALDSYQGAAGPTTFDAEGDVVRHPRIMLIRNGQALPYEQFVAEGGSLLARS